ncbi:MAG: ECF transporter S component [Erysipelotrichales bacterium]|nr:ECF transporter S component [Erysipelotrichales bacterium]
MKSTKKITYLGIGIALYIVLSFTVKIPLFNRIKTDLGYIVFGAYCNLFGPLGTIVGVIGCIAGNLLAGGSFPLAWAIGQAFIGVFAGTLIPKTNNLWIKLGITVIAVLIGIAGIKTVLESVLFRIPLAVRFASNIVAFAADAVPMMIGVWMSERLSKKGILR